jgi:hypothetical protein
MSATRPASHRDRDPGANHNESQAEARYHDLMSSVRLTGRSSCVVLIAALGACTSEGGGSLGASPSEDASVDVSWDSPNGCSPKSCNGVGAECGTAPDACGGVVSCGKCPAGTYCGGGGPNRCGKNPCKVKTCAAAGSECGTTSDGCSNVIDCGPCSAGMSCAANKCTGAGGSGPGQGGSTVEGGAGGTGGASEGGSGGDGGSTGQGGVGEGGAQQGGAAGSAGDAAGGASLGGAAGQGGSAGSPACSVLGVNCTNASECCSGLCDPGQGVCCAGYQLGDECAANYKCCPNMLCIDQICCGASSSPCLHGSDCCSGHCDYDSTCL